MRFKTMLGAALKTAAAAALGLAALGQAGPAAAQGLPGGTWGLAQAVNLTALVPAGSQLSAGTNILDVSCVSPGNCAAIGDYAYTTTGVTSEYPFVLSETGGTWGTPAALAGIPNSNIGNAFVSCAAPGECAAGWNYPGASGYGGGYVIDESGGVWGQAQAVTIGTVGTLLNGVSCAAAGDCTAVGSYVDSAGGLGIGLPFVMDSSNGTWGTPQEVPGFAGLSSPSPIAGELTSVSCTSAGNCVAGGSSYVSYIDGQTHGQPFLATETNGSWGQAQNVAGMATLDPNDAATLHSVSCGGPGDCAAMGESDSAGTWVADESGGSWGPAQQLFAPDGSRGPSVSALSCSTQGFCVIAGSYIPASGGWDTAFTATYTGSAWTVQNVPGLAPPQPQSAATAVSCAAPGYCTVAGQGALAGSGQYQVYLADDVNGTWANAHGVSGVSASTGGKEGVSCSGPGYCTAFGGANAGTTPFTVSEATAAAVTLQASSPTVTYGSEPAQTFTATVSSPAGGTPTGTVAVTGPGGGTLCTITLSGGTGSCTDATPALPAGTDTLTAAYSGDADYVAASGTTTITVVKKATSVTLQASAPAVTYGAEGAETLTATVTSSAGGTPSGTVTVTDGKVAVCSITLANGTGSCTLAATALPAGTGQLTATYNGDASYAAASSTATITVAKAVATVILHVSAPAVTYGAEGAEKLTATVTSLAGGTPTGKVTVSSGSATVCSITLTNATGSCTLAATALPAGTDQLTAAYSGDVNYAAASSTAAITVAKAAYSGTIRLSKMGYCLDDWHNSSSNGAVVQIWQCNGTAAQQWQVLADGTIRHNGLCLDAKGGGITNGTKVILWACGTGKANQKWDTKAYRIHYDNPAATGKVLDDPGFRGAGTQQEIWISNGGINQIWATT